ncbi:TylF/MycF family methyltransferase [Edaphobacter modestus]|uniref:Macrocin-O-methyltransferase TylF n=1 Tax=Edaphobacter modestus TaxID=388466 RepID=A0A4Q7Z042_9BACT|nr:TylF/MycF family methyltransferase [Edaphobacter modestus]RZU43184.1 macrocin-O-methyltransferase TylF [Edaphobacter modestus]
MADYLISIIRPSGYIHSSCFQEVAETLHFALKALGHRAAVIENIVDRQATNIILGAHLLSEAEMKTLPEGTVIYNLEQLGASHLSEAYRRLAERHTIWDYSPVNLERWKEAGCLYPPRLVEIGYAPELRRIVSQAEQDIDVLFYGSVNEHRRKILLQLEQAGINVHCAFGVYGRERDALIARARVVLNLHYYETNLFEIVRVSYLLANSKAVVSEPSPDMGTYADAVAVFPAEKIVAGCLELVRDERRRRELEQRGFVHFSQRSAVRILAEVLPQPANHEQSLQELYLDLVQRCLINVIYEDPNQDRWSPHEYRNELRQLGRDWPSQAHSMIGNARMTNLRRIAEYVLEQKIPGDFIETGVWRGGACIMMRAVLKAYGVTDRRVWAADSFCGLPKPSPDVAADCGDMHHTFSELAISREQVQANFMKYGLLDDQVGFLEGWFSETLPSAPIEELAILRLDGDMYESTMDALVHLYDKVSPGGFVIVDDYGAVPGCRKAVEDFREGRKIGSPIQEIDGYGVFWQKMGAASGVLPRPEWKGFELCSNADSYDETA